MRIRSLAWLLALLPWFAIPAPARAEDEPKPPEEKPKEDAPKPEEKPADTEKKPEKPKTDDTSIIKDHKLAMGRGVAHRRERAAFWAAKNPSGNDLYWLARFWQIAQEEDKAAEAFGRYFAWEPADDTGKEKKEKGSEAAYQHLMEVNLRRKDYEGVVKAATSLREKYPNTQILALSWDQQGRAHRLAGDVDKAIAAFNVAVDNKFAKGMFDLLELLMAEGRYDEAKAAFNTWPKEGAGFRDAYVNEMKGFVDVAMGGGPDLTKLVSAGRVELPSLKDKAVLFYHWHMQIGGPDSKMNALGNVQRAVGDKGVVVGLATYHHYNPEIEKKEEGMTPEAEVDWYKKFAERFSFPIPIAVATKEVMDALHTKYVAQMVIVDGQGRLRWLRIGEDHPYDYRVAELALAKIGGEPPK